MRLFWGIRANSCYPARFPSRIHPALTGLADECAGTLARLMAYVGALVLLAIIGVHLWDLLPAAIDTEPAEKAGWRAASRSYPAFAVSQFDLPEKTEIYEIFRHPAGGRKDVFRWTAPGQKPVAELEIYRPGGEFDPSASATAEIAARMDGAGVRELEAAGIIDSKFGPVTLLSLPGAAAGPHSCLGFIRRFDEPDVRISGWSCRRGALPARRAAIGCILSRLVLLTAGNDPKLAALFARAELKRGTCTGGSASAASADWVTGAENPLLRGTM